MKDRNKAHKIKGPWILLPVFALAAAFAACGAAGEMKNAASSGTATDTTAVGDTGAAIKKITPEDAKIKLAEGKTTLVDVRTADEYAAGHIEGAVLLPNEEIGDARPAALPVADAEIMVYCRSGRRSAEAAKKLAALGYTDIYDLGGIQSWPYETVTGEWQEPKTEGSLTSFATATIDGEMVNESLFEGHTLTMLNIWTTFCGYCLQEMPELATLSGEYADSGLQIVGVVADARSEKDGIYTAESLAEPRELVEKTGAKYLHLLPSASLMQALGGYTNSVPTTIFVDSTGKMVGSPLVGARTGEAWSAIIEEKLEEVKNG